MGPNAEKAARCFAEEINLIRSQDIRSFVLECFDKLCPDYYWSRPASKGGYHPKLASGDGGLVRHTKYAVWWGSQFLRAFSGNGQGDDPGPLNDVVIAALIIHDMVKDGDPARTRPKTIFKMTNYHGVELMEAVFDRVCGGPAAATPNAVPNQDILLIMYGVAAHMGVWTLPENYRPWNLKGSLARKVASIVHMSDYAASRKVDEVIPKLTAFTVE